MILQCVVDVVLPQRNDIIVMIVVIGEGLNHDSALITSGEYASIIIVRCGVAC